MNTKNETVRTEQRYPDAVCFDFKGVLLDHRTDSTLIAGMENLLKTLEDRGTILSVISQNPVSIVKEKLGPVKQFFGSHIHSSGGQGKLKSLQAFARNCGIDDLCKIAFIDDKPDNLLPVARETDVYVIGFQGSGKYPQTLGICKEEEIPFADTVEALETLLMG